MSIIVAKPSGVIFKKELADGEMFFEEPVSVNYVYSDGVNLFCRKNKIYKKSVWKEIEEIQRLPCLIFFNDDPKILDLHCSNWSPVSVNKNIALVSSGSVLGLKEERALVQSDLKALVQESLKKTSLWMPEFLFSYQGTWMLESMLLHTAAIAAINNKGDINIFNKKYGSEHKGVWWFDSFIANINSNSHSFHEEWNEMYL